MVAMAQERSLKVTIIADPCLPTSTSAPIERSGRSRPPGVGLTLVDLDIAREHAVRAQSASHCLRHPLRHETLARHDRAD